MKQSSTVRGLSDGQLAAVVESLPEGIGLFDAEAAPVWLNREARRLLQLRTTLSPEDGAGVALESLLPRLVEAMPTWRSEQHARWTVEEGGVVGVVLRRLWGSQVAAWLSGPAAAEPGSRGRCEGPANVMSPMQIIVAERLLDEAVVGLAVTNSTGQVRWMNQQAERLLGHDAERTVARAARHIARRSLIAPVRLRLQLLPTRAVHTLFWNVAPQLAGVLLHEEHAIRSSGSIAAFAPAGPSGSARTARGPASS
jgi:PAS domain-containing protein